MNHDQTTAKPTLHQYKVGDRVRILKPASGIPVPETGRFVGTLGTVRNAYGNGDVFVEPDAAPDFANSWWYGPEDVEFVESAPAGPGWYVVREWCDDDYAHRSTQLVWACSEAGALEAVGCSEVRDRAVRIALPANPAVGTRVGLE